MDVISATGETLALIASIRELCNSLKPRIDNSRGNRYRFRALKSALTFAEKKVAICSGTLEKYRHAIPSEFDFEIVNLQEIVDTLERVAERINDLEKELAMHRRFFRQFRRANLIAEDISQQTGVIQEVSSRLIEWNEKLKDIVQDDGSFVPDFSSIPNVRVPVHLDFSTTDTVEGKLKATLLDNVKRSSSNAHNVRAHVTAVVGVAGMGGVGKTTALIGLANDPDVRETFSTGGIYFIVVGMDATPEKLVANLKKIVRGSGGVEESEEIDSTGSLEIAVQTTSSWFAGRKALFILDDLWQTSSNEMGYFNELIRLLDDSVDSHLLISTRSSIIASKTSGIIEFKPREIAGSEARKMFLASASLDESLFLERSCEELLQKILGLCGGVPLKLSNAGAQVRRRRGTPIASLKRLLSSLQGSSLLEKQPEHYPSSFDQEVEASISTIADALDTLEEYKKHWEEYRRNDRTKPVTTTGNLVMECFQRLCVLPRSARVSEDLIFGIWGIYNKTISLMIVDRLVDFHLILEFADADGKMKYGLHDVLLDYCTRASQLLQDGKYELYHSEFLTYAWEVLLGEASSLSNTVLECKYEGREVALDAFWLPETCGRGRPWWKVLCSCELSELEYYLLQNLFRHLIESGRLAEAVGVLSQMGWTSLRVTQGGIDALNTDFSLVVNAIRLSSANEREKEACDCTLHGIMSIKKMVGKAWSAILQNPESLPTIAYGHLLDEANKLKVVEQYLKSAESIVSGPWLKPTSAFWSLLDPTGNQRAFRTTEAVVSVAMGSNNVIAATKKMLFWISRESMTATRELVIRNEKGKDSEVTVVRVCEPLDVFVLGFSTGELELRNLRNGNKLREMQGGHEAEVTSVSLSVDGRRVVSGSQDKTVQLWDVGSGSIIGEPLHGHKDFVRSVAISADGRTVASGSDDNMVRLWFVGKRKPIRKRLCGHNDSVLSVGISADGRTVVSSSLDGTVRLWDVRSGSQILQLLRELDNWVDSVEISANGRMVASGLRDGTIRFRDLASVPQISQSVRGHDSTVKSVGMSADGRTVVSGSSDHSVRWWDVGSASQMSQRLREHDPVVSVGMSADGRMMVSGLLDGTVRLRNVRNGSQVGQALRGHDSWVECVGISADGRTVVSGSDDCMVRLWDVRSGSQVCQPLRGHDSLVRSVGISANGGTVVSGSDDCTVRIWDVRSGSQVCQPLRGHDGWVRSVGISADGRTVVSGSDDCTVRIWDVRSGSQVCQPLRGHDDWVRGVGVSGDGQTVVSGAWDGTVRLWDIGSRSQIGEPLRGHDSTVKSVGISADGQTVVSVFGDGNVLMGSRNASGTHWNNTSGASLLPSSKVWSFTFADGEESPSGVVGWLIFRFLRKETVIFELMQP